MANHQQTSESSGVEAWYIADNFGVASEVWMYRQTSMMPRLQLKVLYRKYHNRESFPPKGFEVAPVGGFRPLPDGAIARRATLAWRRIRGKAYGGFDGAPSEAKWFDATLKKNPPAVALAQFGVVGVRLMPLFERHGVPLVVHFNGYDLSSKLRTDSYRTRLQRLAPKFAACIVVANYMAEWLVDNGVPEDRIHKIPYGTPFELLTKAENVGQQPCRCLAVGRFVDKKRPDLTLKAFAIATQGDPAARLIMIGDGPRLAECKSLAGELGIANQVEFLGSQPPERVASELSAAGMFVQHSVTAESGDKEGWPVAIAEAAGAGLPVVSTRHASIPEQVEHGVTGLLCDEHDWKTMGENMRSLVVDASLRAKMGAAARESMMAFDTRRQVGKLESLLLGLANK